MSPDAETRIESAAPKAVDIAAIERELAQLWDEPDAPEAPAHLTRACMSNLVVLCHREPEAAAVARELPAIVRQHPSRVLLLVSAAPHQANDVEAFVSAQCYLGSGDRQVCSEQVVVRAHAAAAPRLPSIVRPLIIGDLPTAFWWAVEGAPAGDELFDELTTVANQVIYDSAVWGDTVPALAPSLAQALALLDHRAVADLAWQRLQPWLPFIGDALDPSDLPGALEAVTELVIEHGPHGLPQALLLAGWFASRLGWQPADASATPSEQITWTLRSPQAPVRAVVRRLPALDSAVGTVAIRCAVAGRPARLQLDALGPGRFGAHAEGVALPARFLAAPSYDRATLVALQLAELGRNALFHEALRMARHLALAVR